MDNLPYGKRITESIARNAFDEAENLSIEAIEKHAEVAEYHFLRAALAAQRGHYEDAIDSYEKSLLLKPNLYISRFQLGLLLASLGYESSAASTLGEISNEEEAPIYLRKFARSIIFVLKEGYSEAHKLLNEGLKLNKENAGLNNDMQQIRSHIESVVKSQYNANEAPSLSDEEDKSETANSYLLEVYNQ